MHREHISHRSQPYTVEDITTCGYTDRKDYGGKTNTIRRTTVRETEVSFS